MKLINKDILKLAVPSILANITVPIVGMVDIAVAGHLDAEAATMIGGIAIGHKMGLHIDMVEKFFLHKGVIAAGVIDGESAIFIQIVAGAFRKIQHAGLMHGDQFLIAADGRGTGGQTQHAFGLTHHLGSKEQRGRLAHLLRIFKHMYLHCKSLLCNLLLYYSTA